MDIFDKESEIMIYRRYSKWKKINTKENIAIVLIRRL